MPAHDERYQQSIETMHQHNCETEQPSREFTKEIHVHFDMSRKVWDRGIEYRV
jgi:hypothetical protein